MDGNLILRAMGATRPGVLRLEAGRAALGVLVVVFALIAPPAHAQGTAVMEGTVKDATGAALGDAKVTLTQKATSIKRSVTTDPKGYYRVSPLSIGLYEVAVERARFRTTLLPDIRLQVDQVARVDITMTVGAPDETVSVQAEAPLVDTATTSYGGVVGEREILELPLNGRNFLALALLVPGAGTSPTGSTQTQWGTVGGRIGFTISGNRDSYNVFTLDGVNVMDRHYNTITVSPSVEAIEEFKIVANSYSAQYGYLPGGQVDIVSRSGTNRFRGSAFEFLRDESLDAKNFFDDPNRPIPPFSQNQFGATLGGPIKKDRTFVFGFYEGLRVRQSLTGRTLLPTAAMRRGDLSGINPSTGLLFPVIRDPLTGLPFPGNQIPQNRINPLAAAILNRTPLPSNPGAAPGTFNHTALGDRSIDNDQFGLRLDHQISSQLSLFARYVYQRNHETEPFVRRFTPGSAPPEGFGNVRREYGQNLGAGLTWTIHPNLVNELRFGYNRLNASRVSANSDVDLLGQLGIPRYGATLNHGVPFITIPGFGQMGDSDNLQPALRRNDSFQFRDDLTYTSGRFTHRGGVDYRRLRGHGVTDTFSQGEFRFGSEALGFGQVSTGTGFSDFLLDRPRLSLIQLGDGIGDYRFQYFGTYYAGSFRVSPRLTLDFGIRYEFETAPTPVDGQFTSILDPSRGAIIIGSTSGGLPPLNDPLTQYFIRTYGIKFLPNTDAGLPASVNSTDYGNVAPRLGFVWDAIPSKLVVRAAGGIYTNLQERPYEVSSNRLGPPFAPTIVSFQNTLFVPGLTPLTYENVFAQGGPADRPASDGGPSTAGVPPGVENGTVYQWSFSLQSQIGRDMAAEAVYVGSRGVHLNGFFIANQNVPNTPERPAYSPDPRYGESFQEHSEGDSWYNGVTVRLLRRFSKGVSFTAGYTFAKSEDTVSTFTGGPTDSPVPQNSYDIPGNKGLSNFDIRHRFILSFLADLPFGVGKPLANGGGFASAVLGGWQLGGIVTLQSGQPFTVQLTGNVSGIGSSGADRPNCVADPNLPSGEQSPDKSFNTGAFTLPTRITPSVGRPYFLLGDCGRNIVTGPGFKNVDLSLSRVFKLGKGDTSLTFTAQAFNLLNHPNFGLPDRFFGSATFGRVSEARFPRQIQFGLRVAF